MMPRLRPYQAEIGRAVLHSILHRRGLSFTVEIARQGGKNELSAQLAVLLLLSRAHLGGDLVKAAPTFLPQARISMGRLTERLRDAGLEGLWAVEAGHIVRLGKARQVFLSAAPDSNVVGNTAHLLLELDEAQDVAPDKFHKEFRPMGASTNVTTVLYGTPWDDATLLGEMKQVNLEQERRDGIRRHFRYDWREVARLSPPYARYVEAERRRLGEEHPLFRTQYALLPLAGGGGFFSAEQQAHLQGHHPRRRGAEPGAIYVAGVDLAGSVEAPPDAREHARRDATVVTIGELDFSACTDLYPEPAVRVVEHYWWTGVPHHQLLPRLADLLGPVWRCRRVVVDATGVGAGIASLLQRALGKAVAVPFAFTTASKSRLGYDLLAAVNTGRVKLYAHDGSAESHEFWRQVSLCRVQYRADRTVSFFVEPSRGHDDFVASLALLAHAASQAPRVARGRAREGVGLGG